MDFYSEEVAQYASEFTEKESPVLAELARETYARVLYPRMLSGHYQGRVLSQLSHMIKPEKILEVGTYTGYSAICLAEGLLPGGELHSIDINDELENMVRKYIQKAGCKDQIHLHYGDARSIIPTLNAAWDLVFIDADKENYTHYFDLIVDNVKVGGYIIADNVLWSGKVLDENERQKDKETEALHTFNQKISADPRVVPLLLPIRDGLLILRKVK